MIQNKLKLENDKTSIQYSSRSYFRLGKNVERNFFKDRNHQPSSMPEMVKGAENFLKSRSKPARTSVKISEIRPVMIGEGLLQINTKQINDKSVIKDIDMKNFGLMNIGNIKCEERPSMRNHSRVLNHRKSDSNSLSTKHKLNKSEINPNNIYHMNSHEADNELEQLEYNTQSNIKNEVIENLNKKKTFSFTKNGTTNTADLKTENDEDQAQNLSRYSNNSNLFSKGNSNLTNKFEEIRQIELKYK